MCKIGDGAPRENSAPVLERPRCRRHVVSHVAAYYPPHLGGLESVVKSLTELLAERHDVSVITTTCGSDGAPHRETVAGVEVRRYAAFALAHTPISPGVALRLFLAPRRSLVHVHIAHAFVPEAVLASSMLRRRPYIAHFHVDVEPSSSFGALLASYKRWILGPCLRHAAGVIVLSDAQKYFVADCYGVRPERITVIPNGVNPAFYRLLDDRRETSTGHRAIRLLNVGRLSPGKGGLRLIDAMTHVSSDAELVIVGDGPLKDEMADRIEKLGLTNVRLVGAAFGLDLLEWYRWADAFVMPSEREGMPLVLLESMAAGLAVVGADAPGVREFVEGVGLLTQLDAESIGAAIEKVASDPDLLAKLSAASAARAIEFDWEEAVADLERIYDSVAIT